MPDHILTPLVPLAALAHRLDQIQESLEAIEASLVRLSARLARIEAQHREDHSGVGRGGLSDDQR